MALILISGDRLQHAVSRATEAVEKGERMSVRLNNSLSLLKTSRDELKAKLSTVRAEEFPGLAEDWLDLM